MTFSVPLITFTTGQPLVPGDVNTNFSNLNNASVFNGTISHLNSDGGLLVSTGLSGANGNLLVGGGKLGIIAPGDRIDAGSTPGSLVLTGGQSITFSTAGIAGAIVNATGVGQDEVAPFSFINATPGTDQGYLQSSSSFTGIGSGTYNHGLDDIPDFAIVTQNVGVGFGETRTTVSIPATNSIVVTCYTDNPFVCWCILYQ